MQAVKILSYGFFTGIDDNNISRHLPPKSNEIVDNNIIYFECAANCESKIDFDCGFFCPKTTTTDFKFKSVKSENYEGFKIVTMKPDFFVFLLPYPTLERHYNDEYHRSSTKTISPHPYQDKRLHFRKDGYVERTVEFDLSNKISIKLIEYNNGRFNHFMSMYNSCYPIFVEDINEIRKLVNDYHEYVYSNLGFEIDIKSLTKIIIPFFNINNFDSIK